ncbi:hypothetical protein Taro_042133 [Colocasia esculenta]|uniref:Phytocyanin domain-containing protein n=1 Tax=Colocasia esculenta TaxID=4460 RepID=A0A843WXS1_COLES|nr:hypothetical protein [Colocasia esculenta]
MFAVFNFVTNVHDVLQVSRADFENCNTQSPIASYINGPATVNLNTSGDYYFICGVGVHCSQLRQRMTLSVVASSTSAPPPTTGGPTVGTPPPPTTTTPPPTSTPSGPSGAASSNGHGKAAIAAVVLTASVAALVL